MNEQCFVNAMLIQKYADEAARLRLGVVHELAWISADPGVAPLRLRELDVMRGSETCGIT